MRGSDLGTRPRAAMRFRRGSQPRAQSRMHLRCSARIYPRLRIRPKCRKPGAKPPKKHPETAPWNARRKFHVPEIHHRAPIPHDHRPNQTHLHQMYTYHTTRPERGGTEGRRRARSALRPGNRGIHSSTRDGNHLDRFGVDNDVIIMKEEDDGGSC
jgi:hypothetical protein